MIKQLTFILSLFVAGFVSAQTITWNGLGTTNNFSDAGNWVGGVAPSSTNAVLFNSTGTKNCTIDASVTVTGFTIASGYSGTINGSTFALAINGSYVQADGTFDATSDTLRITTGSFLRTGGTFNHNNSSVVMNLMTSATTTINGSTVFHRLILRPNVNAGQKNVNFGSIVTETLSVQSGTIAFAYVGSANIRSRLDLRGTGNVAPTSNTATFTLGGTGNFTLSSQTSATSRDRMPNLVFDTPGNIVLQNYLSMSGNWTHVNGTFVPGTAYVIFYGNCSILGSANIFNSLGVASTTTLNFPAGAEVQLKGNLEIASGGVVSFPSTSRLGFSGTGFQDVLPFASTGTLTFGSIRVYQGTGARAVSLAGSGASYRFRLLDSLKIDAGSFSTTFATNSKLTLVSTSSLKARIANLGSSNQVTGSLTVQTNIPGGTTGWTNLGVAGVAGQTVKSWDTYSTSLGVNGIPMTCSGCSWDENSVAGGPFHSIQNWTESTDTYGPMTGASSLARGVGYWVYVGNGPSTTSDMTLVNTGTLVQGNVNVSVSNSSTGFNLVANPYASPINWATVFAASSNIANAIYIWNPDLNTTTSFVSGVSSHVAGANNVIPAGQGFHVQATGGGASVNFTEAAKIHNNTSANPLLRGSSNSENIGDVFRLKLASSSSSDYMAFRIHNQASEAFDTQWDALKRLQSPGYPGYPGPYTKYTTLSSKDKYGVDYSVHSIAPPTSSVSIPVMARVETSGTYSIEAIDAENAGACLFIKDKVTGLTHDLAQSAYVFTISDTTQAPRFELLLCPRYAQNPNSIAELIKDNSVQVGHENGNLLVKTNYASTTVGTISVFNLLGQQVIAPIRFHEQSQLHTIAVEGSNDVLVVRITSEEGTVSRKVMMK